MIVAAFDEQKRVYPLYILGWILPIVAMIPYCIVNTVSYNRKCWTQTIPALAWIYSIVPLTALIVGVIVIIYIYTSRNRTNFV